MIGKKNVSALFVVIPLACGFPGCDQIRDEIAGDTGGGGSDSLVGKPEPEFALEMMGNNVNATLRVSE